MPINSKIRLAQVDSRHYTDEYLNLGRYSYTNLNSKSDTWKMAVVFNRIVTLSWKFFFIFGLLVFHSAASLPQSLDSFNPGANYSVELLIPKSDGNLLAGGLFTTLAGQSVLGLGQLRPDGTLDEASSPRFGLSGSPVVILGDGRMVVADAIASETDGAQVIIRQLRLDFSVDESFLEVQFLPSPTTVVNCLALQPDGKIIVGGQFILSSAQGCSNLVRLNADGTLDREFTPLVDGKVRCLGVRSGGQIVVGGDFQTINSQPRPVLASLNSDGSLDDSFVPEAHGNQPQFISCLSIQPDGRILATGEFSLPSGQATLVRS